MPANQKPTRDKLGNIVPKWLSNAFRYADRARDDIDRISYCIVQAWKVYSRDKRYEFRGANVPTLASAVGQIEEVLRNLKAAVPFAVCQCCDLFEEKETCYCHGTGWLSREEYHHVLREAPQHARRLFRKSANRPGA